MRPGPQPQPFPLPPPCSARSIGLAFPKDTDSAGRGKQRCDEGQTDYSCVGWLESTVCAAWIEPRLKGSGSGPGPRPARNGQAGQARRGEHGQIEIVLEQRGGTRWRGRDGET